MTLGVVLPPSDGGPFESCPASQDGIKIPKEFSMTRTSVGILDFTHGKFP